MELLAKLIGNVMMDIVPEADNAYEAIDLYSQRLYKRIQVKEKAQIDSREDLELYLFINGYKSKIGELVHKQALLQVQSDRIKGRQV